ncbi:MAG: precorrin-2 C(20)-methyltransferase [Deltaproteobacteria bacterium]|nr:MAG: precorrin-2 C(20)-methyltransferase [Deltaproteobacteria bacterium]
MATGTLYGIGVGPGDPELVTLKAIKVLKKVDLVFAASSTKNHYSLAMNIVSRFVEKSIPVIFLKFPMTRDRTVLEKAWDANAKEILSHIRKGKDVAFITLGDPMTYSTFGYIMRVIRKLDPGVPVQVVPGITSYHAAASAAGQVIAEAEESFAVVSGALGARQLKRIINHTDNVIMLKVYRNYKEIMSEIDRQGLAENATLITRCGLEGEEIIHNIKRYYDKTPPYLSLLIIKKQKDHK